jgi:acyl-coenzyme A thioesterase PaaI-like protein
MKKWPELSLERTADYQSCFGCGRDNPIGLKLVFQWDGTTARSEFIPPAVYQGWPGILHGGIMACILDEAMGYAALFDVGRCVTAKMQIDLKQPVPIGSSLIITSTITRKTRKLVETEASVTLKDGQVLAEATGTHFVVNTVKGVTDSGCIDQP